MNVRGWVWVGLVGGPIAGLLVNLAAAASNSVAKSESSAQSANPQPHFIRPPVKCPADVETLTKAMLRDLPGYVNRAYLRTIGNKTGAMSYAIAASQPDFEPLPTVSSEYANPPDPHLHQIFFTLLERRYSGQQIAELQTYHWLFLSETPDGWTISLMFSRFGSYPANQQPITSPRESSQSLTAQAIRLWLRDCQAGAVRL